MSDSIFESQIVLDSTSDRVTHRLTQPTEDLILERAKQLRNNPGALQDLGARSEEGTWGRMVATVPFILYQWALKNGYDLNSKDSEIASREMFRFLKSPEGQPCLVREDSVR